MAQRRKAIVTSVVAVYVACPDCGGDCEAESGDYEAGTLMVEEGRKARCTICGETWEVPQSVFRVPARRKPQNDCWYETSHHWEEQRAIPRDMAGNLVEI